MRRISCDQARVDIPLYIERELSPDENLVTAYHLAACAPCSETAEVDRELLGISANAEFPDPPSGLTSNIIGTLKRVRGSVSPRAMKWAALGLLLAVCAASQVRLSGGQTVGWTLLLRLGELLHFGDVLAGVSVLIPDLSPSAFSFIDSFLNGAGTTSGGSGMPPLLPSLFGIILTITLSVCAISGALLLSGAVLARPRRGYLPALRGFLTRS
jgi:hypothetical protein